MSLIDTQKYEPDNTVWRTMQFDLKNVEVNAEVVREAVVRSKDSAV